mmetsp:Transcript_6575/g.19307  ORF Transcript_6575/g.19307 Transcript_6575/m.19307 type:complete len:319 (-) Transcript_6575:27-983(-)
MRSPRSHLCASLQLVFVLAMAATKTAFAFTSIIAASPITPAQRLPTKTLRLTSSSGEGPSRLLSRSNPPSYCRKDVQIARFMTTADSNDDEQLSIREQASKLRQEAEELEKALRQDPNTKKSKNASSQQPAATVISVFQLEDSTWTFRYRFSSQPEPKDSNKNSNNNESTASSYKPTFYSGSASIRLRNDGYSELVDHSPRIADNDIKIGKVWGWDQEYSSKDDENYLLLSMDVQFPNTDPMLPQQSERYYFQARIDEGAETSSSNNKKSLLLNDGTITCKKDITDKTGGRWGLFQVAGILTEFRYVGDFIAKPSASI